MKRPSTKALTVATSLAVAGAVAGSGALASDFVASNAVEPIAYTVPATAYHATDAFAPRSDNRATFAERASRDAADRAARIEKIKAAKAKAARAKARKAAAREAAAAKRAAAAEKKQQLTTRPVARGTARDLGKRMAAKRGWTGSQWAALDKLWTAESGWGVTAGNNSTGAYGIPQALPGSKMSSAGSDWRTSASTQIEWGLNYIDSRWGSPMGAWGHFQANHWY